MKAENFEYAKKLASIHILGQVKVRYQMLQFCFNVGLLSIPLITVQAISQLANLNWGTFHKPPSTDRGQGLIEPRTTGTYN